MRQLIFMAFLSLISISCFSQKFQPTGKIIIIDKKLNNLIDTDASLEIIAEGFNWSEGPLWLAAKGKILGRILTGQATSNFAFSQDYSILYITADSYILRVSLNN